MEHTVLIIDNEIQIDTDQTEMNFILAVTKSWIL